MGLPVLGAAISIGTSIAKRFIKNKAKKEIGRIAARGGALSGPISGVGSTIAASGGGFVNKAGRVAGAVAGTIGVGVGVEAVSNFMNGRSQKRRYRRMQVTNMKALDRALRRVDGFQKRVKKAFIVSGDLKPRKRGRCR